ncbi:MAG: hypothetical protein VR64_20415 [Desulfatitalea sp. BRH_c12]|nr:MAG: hypothetical protein VR64_20415 [Desulfatitalea sp. BRH_c12]
MSAYSHTIAKFSDGRILVECGPMRMVIGAYKDGISGIEDPHTVAAIAISFFTRVAEGKRRLAMPAQRIDRLPDDAILAEMIQSTSRVGDPDLTPMAAVAGTLADAVADWLFERDMTKVVVDNGGDIAIRLGPGENVVVGVCPQPGARHLTRRILLDARCPSWGVATSGMGGRSFTRGIASAVTTVSHRASLADAAATAIANACFVPDEAIRQAPAELIDPDTDIPGVPITVQVGRVSSEKLRQAGENTRKKAEEIQKRGIISGALIQVGHTIEQTEFTHGVSVIDELQY